MATKKQWLKGVGAYMYMHAVFRCQGLNREKWIEVVRWELVCIHFGSLSDN